MRKITIIAFTLLTLFINGPTASAEQNLISVNVPTPPHIDGIADDKSWEKAKEITTHDRVANIDVTLRSIHTTTEIYFLVQFPDPEESRLHKPWIWDKKQQLYIMGPHREDSFVFKWALNDQIVDLSLAADVPYEADIWFWKAHRTDPSGYADDKLQKLSEQKNKNSKKLNLTPNRTMYLSRLADHGSSAYKSSLHIDYTKDLLPQFHPQTPSSSRADIRAKGIWRNGMWTIEFMRLLKNNNTNDIQFDLGKSHFFGISRYEMAGRPKNPKLRQPLYGSGDVSEKLFLIFEK